MTDRQQADPKCRRGKNFVLSAHEHSATQDDEDAEPACDDQYREWDAHFGGNLECRIVRLFPSPVGGDWSVPTAVGWKNPAKGAEAGSEPRVLLDDFEGRKIGVPAP